MAQPPRQPLFLARSGYRQRRLRDAIRVLPVAAVILLMIPLLWPRGPAGPGNGQVLIYVFVVWTLMIVLAFAMTRRLRPDQEDTELAGDIDDGLNARGVAPSGGSHAGADTDARTKAEVPRC